jgi:hypothetical protein
MKSPNDVAPAPLSPWGEDSTDQDWAALAEQLQRDAELQGADVDIPEPVAVRPLDPRLQVQLEQYTPQRISDYNQAGRQAGNKESATLQASAEHASAEGPHQTPSWWNKEALHAIQKPLRERVFTEVTPGEVFVVGQEGKGVRIFNFGAPLSAERQEDCKKFVDTVSQYMGDRMYDFVTDIVIADFADTQKGKGADSHDIAGFAYVGHGLILANTAIVPDDAPRDETAEGSSFLQTLTHEYGHLFHGDVRQDAQAREDLETFASDIGWDIEGMQEDGHDWLAKNADNQPYAPLYARPNTITMPPDGSPTEYGAKNPKESLGETNKHAMLGSSVMAEMTETNDAWLTHLQTRMLRPGETIADRPIASPLEHKPITMTRYSGADIRYPA